MELHDPSPTGDAAEVRMPLSHVLERAATGMLQAFGPLFYLMGLHFLMRRLRLEDHSARRIQDAAGRGPVVYLLYQRSLLDWLALNAALNARNLPIAAVTPGLHPVAFLPLAPLLRALRDRLDRTIARFRGLHPPPEPDGQTLLRRALDGGLHACLFLMQGQGFLDRFRTHPLSEPVETLLSHQAHTDRPIQIVPVVVVWDRSPPAARSEVWRAVLGDDAWPTGLTRLFLASTRGDQGVIQAGEAVDLREFLARTEGQAEARRSRVLRIALRRFLYREQSVVRGPRVRSRRWMKRLVLESPPIQELIRNEARASGRTQERIRRKVDATFERIAARMSFTFILLARHVTVFLWNRIYSGVDIRPEDLDRVRVALRRGTPILVPCHRSHLDYVLVSSIFYLHDIVIPYVIAGINLSFWPLGPVLRRLGAVFIKRTFKGDPIFAEVFNRYLHQLVREGYPVEFFIEGGRSRTGKVLPPRLGVLHTLVDAANLCRSTDFEVTFLPMSINYEQVAEEASYAREILGERKEKESIAQLLRAPKVLRHRYGRVYLRVGEPILSGEVLDPLETPWPGLPDDRKQEVLEHLGRRILHRVNQQAVVQPTALVAMAILAHGRRGIRRATLLARVERLRTFLAHKHVAMSASLAWPAGAVDEAIGRFQAGHKVTVFLDGDEPVYRLAEDRRVTLEYYKNTILHCFVPASLLALVLRRQAMVDASAAADDPTVVRTFHDLVRMFRTEFILDPDTPDPDRFGEARADLVRWGALSAPPDEQPVRVCDADLLLEMACLVAPFVESYTIALKGAHQIRDRATPGPALVSALHKHARGLLAVDEIRWAEAVSTVTLQNATRVFEKDGLFEARAGGQGLDFDEPAARRWAVLLQELRV